jgi:hypothetical protein
MLTQKSPKISPKFTCEKCDYKCSKESEYKKHLATRKHINTYNCLQKTPEQSPKLYTCSNCNKGYKFRQSLYNHKKMCQDVLHKKDEPISEENPDIIEFLINENKEFKNVIIDLVKNNSELQKQMLEVCKNGMVNNSINNSHNKTFNLQFFLNETCKDAMNIMDFVDSFTLQLSDLEDVSKQGYVDGISNIIMKKLNELDVHKRPIHCSDAKREIMYVKDQNRWEKEDLGYAKLRKAIKYISKKNSDLLGQWSEAHPASKNITTQTNTEYMQMIVQAMGGRGEIGENENKIIKKIARTVLIEKV